VRGGARRAALGLRLVELAVQQRDRLLQLVDRRVLDAADPDRAVDRRVDLRVRAAVDPAQVRHERVTLGAQGGAALEGRQLGLGSGSGSATAAGTTIGAGAGGGSPGRGEQRHLRRDVGGERDEADVVGLGLHARGALEQVVVEQALVTAVVLGVQVVAQLGLDVGGHRAQPPVAGRKT
jgi:hypothetical protein